MHPSHPEALLDINGQKCKQARSRRASLEDVEWPWPLPLEAALCLHSPAEMQSATSKARRDGQKGRQSSDSAEIRQKMKI